MITIWCQLVTLREYWIRTVANWKYWLHSSRQGSKNKLKFCTCVLTDHIKSYPKKTSSKDNLKCSSGKWRKKLSRKVWKSDSYHILSLNCLLNMPPLQISMHLSVISQQMNVKSIQRKKFIKINKQKKNQDQVSWNFFQRNDFTYAHFLLNLCLYLVKSF